MRYKVDELIGGRNDLPRYIVVDLTDNRVVGEYGSRNEAEAAAALRQEKQMRLEKAWKEQHKVTV